MRIFLRLFFINAHSTLAASIIALTVISFMLHDVNALNLLSAIDARYHYIRASSLVHIDVLPKTFCFADFEGLTFYGIVFTELVVILHLRVIQNLLAAKLFILASEFHWRKLFLNFFLYVNETRFSALHRTLASFLCKFIKTNLMESLAALLALPRIY